MIDEQAFSAESASEYAHDLSVGLMLALERLSPLERAAFLPHDVFDLEYGEVAGLLERNETTCRQLAARARVNVRAARPRFEIPSDGGHAIVEAFVAAARSGDVTTLAQLLSEDAILHSDGGGKRKAALRIIRGRDRAIRGIIGVLRKFVEPAMTDMRFDRINGMPGLITVFSDGGLQTTAFQIERDRITDIYVVRNPDKLGHLAQMTRME